MKHENIYFSEQFKGILSDLSATYHNRRTFDGYLSYANLICNFLEMDFLDIEEPDAERYFSYLKQKVDSGELSRPTFCSRLSACRTLAGFILENDYVPGYKSPFTHIVRPEVDVDVKNDRIPTMEELDKIITAAKESSAMDYVIFLLASRMCLSSMNILNLTRHHVMKEGGRLYINVVTGQGDSKAPRYVAVPSDIAGVVEEYVKTGSGYEDEAGHLFFNEHHRPMTLRNLSSRVDKIVAASNIGKRFTMKDLRSRGIIELVNTGADTEDVRQYVGLGTQRINTFMASAKYVDTNCPPEMTNYKVVV